MVSVDLLLARNSNVNYKLEMNASVLKQLTTIGLKKLLLDNVDGLLPVLFI